MKNIDIEQIERKNIYTTPPDFFAKMQEKVLQETVHKKAISEPKTKIFKINWGYAAAASVTLFLGVIGVLQLNNESKTQDVEQHISKVTDSTYQTEDDLHTDEPSHQVAHAYVALQKDIETIEKENGTNTKTFLSKASTVGENTKSPKQSKPTLDPVVEVQIDQMMKELSNVEFADLSKGAEQDVYLDIYN